VFVDISSGGECLLHVSASSKLCAITTQLPFRLKQSLGSATKHKLSLVAIFMSV